MENEHKLYGLTNDFLFKAVFGQESNKKLFEKVMIGMVGFIGVIVVIKHSQL